MMPSRILTSVITFGVLVFGQTKTDLSPAHDCARCHLHDILEWSLSKHQKAGTACVACHGPSVGHVEEERNAIKPDRVPHGAAIAALCATCHQKGCPKTKRQDSCQTCHHVHALVDVSKKTGPGAETRKEQRFRAERQQYLDRMAAGAELVKQAKWKEANDQFMQALALRPGDPSASQRIAFCRRRLNPELPGFRAVGSQFDPATGLPASVEEPILKLKMVLVAGGDADIGDPRLPDSNLVHTVHIEPFYLGQHEVTQQQWQSVMGSNPSAHKQSGNDVLPVESVSWKDCQEFVNRLNAKVAGGGFRLPTEAEWEYAARQSTAGSAVPDSAAWYRENAQFKTPGKNEEPVDFLAPHPVGSKTPNRLGLFDTQGNVWEWCSSLFRPYPYSAADGREDPNAEGLRVLRGGSFVDRAELLSVGLRHGERPGRRVQWNGLRLARSVPGN